MKKQTQCTRIEHRFDITQNKTAQLQLLATACDKSVQAMIAKIIKSVCECGFYHFQLSHDKELMARLESVSESHRMARSEIIYHAVLTRIREMELERLERD